MEEINHLYKEINEKQEFLENKRNHIKKILNLVEDLNFSINKKDELSILANNKIEELDKVIKINEGLIEILDVLKLSNEDDEDDIEIEDDEDEDLNEVLKSNLNQQKAVLNIVINENEIEQLHNKETINIDVNDTPFNLSVIKIKKN